TRIGRIPTGANELSTSSATNAVSIGVGRRHQGLNLKYRESWTLALAAKARDEMPEVMPATTTVVGPSKTSSKPTTAIHPRAAPRRSTPYTRPAENGLRVNAMLTTTPETIYGTAMAIRSKLQETTVVSEIESVVIRQNWTITEAGIANA